MEKGYIITEVRSRGEALPIVGATVTISAYEKGELQVVNVQKTDISGSTLPFEIDTPPKADSLTPNPSELPFSTVSIEIDKSGFLTQIFAEVPIFSGITTIQPVQLIPLNPDAYRNSPVKEDEI
ncbi:MAG: hypothetical protein IJZ03_04000 [Clostridia bacterium]|nr:hypothetical protein [Clostridia bacterium]